MKRFIVLMLMMGGMLSAPAMAAPGGSQGRPGSEPQAGPQAEPRALLPAETIAAFETIAEAVEARRAGADAVVVDARLAEGLQQLAASVPALGDETAFVTFVHVEVALVGPEVAARLGRDVPDGGELGLALDGLGAARREWLERHVADASDAPRSQCFQNFVRCMSYCSSLETAILRAACGLDCDTDFIACLPFRIPGIIGEIIRNRGTGLFN